MANLIGEAIKSLRRARDISQEYLAERLNVSAQAVSKWERGDSMPDVAMIAPIADYFGVTADVVLGIDRVKNETRITAYLAEHARLGALGFEVEKADLTVAAYREFPNDWRVIQKYMWTLVYDPQITEKPWGSELHRDELHRLCARVLDECTVDDVRYDALSILGGLYADVGDMTKAAETVNRLPPYNTTREEETELLYERGTDEWWPLMHDNIRRHVDMTTYRIRNAALHSDLPPREKIRILQKAVDLIKLIYDEGDYGFQFYNLCELYIWIANRHIELGEYDTAFERLDQGLAYGRAYDELPLVSRHTSFLVNRLEQNMMNITSGSPQNEIARELGYLNGAFYDAVREMEGFKAVVARYEPYAGEKRRG
jgi:transcriptional regulator with XRE-family HTH domain